MNTKKTKHTPGPWMVKPAQLNPRDPMFYKAAVICGGIRLAHVAGIGEENANANARLIAAAPELLEACKSAIIALKDARVLNIANWKYEAQTLCEKAVGKCEK